MKIPETMSRLFPWLMLLSCGALFVACEAAKGRSQLNVRDFGASGHGIDKDTAVIQKALDVCADAGGGEVIVPAGNYLIGSIELKSNTTLRLEHDANLLGSPDLADYPLIKIQ
jgi:polygalacturonase